MSIANKNIEKEINGSGTNRLKRASTIAAEINQHISSHLQSSNTLNENEHKKLKMHKDESLSHASLEQD